MEAPPKEIVYSVASRDYSKVGDKIIHHELKLFYGKVTLDIVEDGPFKYRLSQIQIHDRMDHKIHVCPDGIENLYTALGQILQLQDSGRVKFR